MWRFCKKLKIELPYDPAIPVLNIYLEKNIVQKDTHTPVFFATLFTITKTWKQSKHPFTEEWIKMFCVIYTYIYIHTIQWNIVYIMEYYI